MCVPACVCVHAWAGACVYVFVHVCVLMVSHFSEISARNTEFHLTLEI